jgi:hypothetical protein
MVDLLIQAMSAKQSGDITLAKQLLSQAILHDPRNEAAWMLLADVVDDVKQRRNCLERVVAINPNNDVATQELARLSTTPLKAPFQAEREKPTDIPSAEKTPPFTPPFTWDGKPEQYLALGELTFPDLTNEEEVKLPETPPTFDWANESPEPDKTIDKIFEAVSQPELATEPPAENEASWLDGLRPEDDIIEKPPEEKKPEVKKVENTPSGDTWLNELVESEVTDAEELRTLTADDFSVSAEPEFGLQAFASEETAPPPSSESDSLLWDNPKARTDRLVILSYRSLIFAHPNESDIAQIMELYNTNRMVRGLLGEKAQMIKLDTIERVIANPKSADILVEYKPNGKVMTHLLSFSSPMVREEVISALKFRLGAGFKQTSHTITLEDKILSPIMIIVFVALVAWVLLGGVPLLSTLPGFETGASQAFLASVQQVIDQIGSLVIILVAAIISAACVAWLVLNLRKPSSEVIIKR